jgi:hypothetical protein
MVERDAALAGGGTTHPLKLPSGAGAPLGGTMTSRQELADGGPHGSSAFGGTASRKGPRQGTMDAPARVARSAARCRQDAAAARREALVLPAKEARHTLKRRVLRRAVPLALREGQGNEGAPGACQRIRAAERCLTVVPAKAGTQYAAVPRDGTAYWIPGLPPIKSGVARDDSRA